MAVQRTRNTVVVLLGLMAVLAGCGDDARVVDPGRFLGEPLSEVDRQLDADPAQPLPPDFGYVLYDLSGAVTDRPSGQRLGRPAADWTVVVSCATVRPASAAMAEGQTLVLGVVPRASATVPVREQARQHAFDARVSECAVGRPTVTLPRAPSEIR